jgi:hypothetical protein
VPMWCVAPLEINEGNSLGGKGTIALQAATFFSYQSVGLYDKENSTMRSVLYCMRRRACTHASYRSDKLYDSTDQDEDTGFILGHYPNTETS